MGNGLKAGCLRRAISKRRRMKLSSRQRVHELFMCRRSFSGVLVYRKRNPELFLGWWYREAKVNKSRSNNRDRSQRPSSQNCTYAARSGKRVQTLIVDYPCRECIAIDVWRWEGRPDHDLYPGSISDDGLRADSHAHPASRRQWTAHHGHHNPCAPYTRSRVCSGDH